MAFDEIAEHTAGIHISRVTAWDLPTRLFKWTLVALVAMARISNKYGSAVPEWHKATGYAILTLVVFRVLWGVVGGSTARFSMFFPHPKRTLVYAGAFLLGRARPYLGHNPIGAIMILTLLTGLAFQAVCGLYAADPDRLIIEGPLAATVSDSLVDQAARWHRWGFNALLILISIHVTANLFYDLFKKEGLIRAMFSGTKPKRLYEDAAETKQGSILSAAICLAVAVAIVFGGIAAAGGRHLF
jgi:cytochrome b